MNIVFFTGAGISKESGIPTFRGKGGIFNEDDNDAELELTLSRFQKNPEKSWKFLRKIFDAGKGKKYNRAHEIIAAFEDASVITQNIDSFHKDAGSKKVFSIHGEFGTGTCSSCGKKSEIKEKCDCGSWIKPDIVFYDESLNIKTYKDAISAAKEADIFVVIGTTGLVQPAAGIPGKARNTGATVIEINPETSSFTESLTDIFIQEKAIRGMETLLEEVFGLDYLDGKLKDYKNWKKNFNMESLVQEL